MAEKYDANSAPQYGAPPALPREHSGTQHQHQQQHQHNASHSHGGAGHYSGQGVSTIGSLGTTAGYTPGNFQHAHAPADATAAGAGALPPPPPLPSQAYPQQQAYPQHGHYGVDEGVAYQQNSELSWARHEGPV